MKKKIFALSLASALMVGTFAFVLSHQNSVDMFGVKATPCAHAHVNHYARVEPTLLKSGVEEYWVCCECHTSYKDSGLTEAFENTAGGVSNPSDGRYIAPLGSPVYANMTKGTVSEEAAGSPIFTTVYERTAQGFDILKDTDDANIDVYERLAFQVKAGVWFIIRGSWDYSFSPNNWRNFELVQTSSGVWDIYAGLTADGMALKVSGVEGHTLQDVMILKGESSTYYVTNLRGIRVEPSLKKVRNASVASLSSDVVALDAPSGFTSVSKGATTYNDDNQGQNFLVNIDGSGYQYLTFAFQTKNRSFSNYGWAVGLAKDTWFIVTITNDGGTYSSVVKDLSGTTKFSYSGKASFSAALPYYNFGGSENLVWISTEVRGLRIAPTLEKVANASVNYTYGEVLELDAPEGFESVIKGQPYEGSVSYDHQGKTFLVDIDGSDFEYLTFAFRTENRRFCNSGWGGACAMNTWFIVTITNDGGAYSSVVKDLSGNTKMSYSEKASFKAALPYYNYDGTEPVMIWNTTEVRGLRKA